MKILIINCGSSSLKYQLFDMDTEDVMVKGLVERIGIEGSRLVQTLDGKKTTTEKDMPDHDIAVKAVFDAITSSGVVDSIDEIDAVGHRVVHGGDKMVKSVLIDDEVKDSIREFSKFAPLHNPANLMGIEACEKILPGKPNVAVFDTSFHQTMPEKTFMYAIPYEYYEKHTLRKFGFHGTSHRYISLRTAELMNKDLDELNLVTCHLGNGASLCAVKNGKSYDTTMGLTPLEGLAMGTRSGDLDPTVINFLEKEEGLTGDQVNDILNKESGVLGISGVSSDFRDLEEAADGGNERARIALDLFETRVRRYLGGYIFELGHVDAICFAGGIGENSATTRKAILEGLEEYGIVIDDEANDTREEALISAPESKINVYVVPTDEELMIARDTKALVE